MKTKKSTVDVAVVDEIPPCDVCGFPHAAYDAATKQGPWAYLCEDCFKEMGIGLGLGVGQKLELRDE